MLEGYVQVAPDSVGKKVVMEQIVLSDGTTAYRQIAVLGGETGDILQETLEESRVQTKLLTMLCRMMQSSCPEYAGVDLLDKDKWSI